MTTLIYDKTFNGLLTAVFEVYEYKFQQPKIVKENSVNNILFGYTHVAHTSNDKAERVLSKVKNMLTYKALLELYAAFLSEADDIENNILHYIQHLISSQKNIETDWANNDVRIIKQTARKVTHEAHKIKGFVRFHLTNNQLYYSVIDPEYNILPLITHHFKHRFSDQQWLIYDEKRRYGIYYDLNNVTEVNILPNLPKQPGDVTFALHEDEVLYQQLWRKYFKSTFIEARKNTKLHVQNLPKKYWKNLVEKLPIDL